jgi:mono/diheme cytochrome c family protein
LGKLVTYNHAMTCRACGTFLACFAVVSVALGSRAIAQDPGRNVWQGVYTEAQAARGRELYRQHCGYCHRDDLTGGGSEAGAPALTGPIFFYRWLHSPLSDMFLTIGTTMPQNKPDSLTPRIVIDVVSFLLQQNEMPAGNAELPPDFEALKKILVTEKTTR